MVQANLTTNVSIDIDILTGCIEGNRIAQQQLYETFSPTMFGICLRYSKDYHSAEDLLQDGFIKVYNNVDRYKGSGNFEGWMKRIFINTAIEAYRKNLKKVTSPLQEETFNHAIEEDVLDKLAADDLLKIIQLLPKGYRTVFNLYCIEGYSHKEISEMLGISEGTSKSQLARAKGNIKGLLKKLH